MPRLIPEAHYSNEAHEFHIARADRRVDGHRFPRDSDNVVDLDENCDRLVSSLRELDPDGEQFREILVSLQDPEDKP